MEYRNLTPFPSLAFQSYGQDAEIFHVIALRATYQIINGQPLKAVQQQLPLCIRDQFYGEINQSSIQFENDLAPFKPKCDVIVNATAHAPAGNPAPNFEVGLRMHSKGQPL